MPKPMEFDDILADIGALNSRYQRCPVAAALRSITDERVAAAFEHAMKAERDEFQHQAIARKLGELGGKRVTGQAVAKHRLTLAGQTGGCSCGR